MIEMWDEIFSQQNPEIIKVLENKDGNTAFEVMHINDLEKKLNMRIRKKIPGSFRFCETKKRTKRGS